MVELLRMNRIGFAYRSCCLLFFRAPFLLVPLGILLGCGSSGEIAEVPGINAPPVTIDVFEFYETTGSQLTLDIAGEAPTQSFALPVNGSVNYAGVAGFGYDSVRLAGATHLIVNFESNDMVGEVTQISSSEGFLFEGVLYFRNLSLDRDVDVDEDFSVSGSMYGELIGESSQQVAVDAEVRGDFFQDGEVLSGVLEGEVVSGDDVFPILNGVIVAESSSGGS